MFPSLPVPDEYRKLSDLYVPQQEAIDPPMRNTSPFDNLDLMLAETLEEQNNRSDRSKQAAQRMARTNAVTDAFRLVSQAVGGTMGATIPREQPNQGVLNAFNQYQNLDKEQRDRIDRYRSLELQNALRKAQMEYGAAEKERDRAFTRDLKEDEQEFTMERDKALFGERRDLAGFEAEQRRDLQELQGRQRINQLEKQGQTAKEVQELRNEGYKSYRRTGSAMETMDPQMRRQVQDALVDLYRKRQEEDQTTMLPQAIRSIERNEVVRDESMEQLMMDNYDYLAQTIPGFEQTVSSPQRMTQQQSALPGNPVQGNRSLLQQKVRNILTREGRPDKPRKELKMDRRPQQSAEKQMDDKDRVGYLMRALKEYDPSRTPEEYYQMALELIQNSQ